MDIDPENNTQGGQIRTEMELETTKEKTKTTAPNLKKGKCFYAKKSVKKFLKLSAIRKSRNAINSEECHRPG